MVEDGILRVEPYRFFVLAIFCLNSGMCAMTALQFTAIREEIKFFYDVDNGAVNWTNLLASVIAACLLFPTGWLFQKKGLRWALVCCSLFTVVGQGIKCFCWEPDMFYVLLVGQTVVSFGQVFVFPGPSRLASDWFAADDVSVASALAVLSNPIGVALSFLVAPLVATDLKDKTILKKYLQNYQYGMTGAAVAIMILTVIGIRDKPEFPPSIAAEYRRKDEESKSSNYFTSIKTFMKNKNFLLHLFSYGVVGGAVFNINTIFTQIVTIGFPGELKQIGWIGFYYIIFGVVAATFVGYYLDKAHRYKFMSVLMCVSCIFACVLLTLMNRLMHNVNWLYIPTTFFGVGSTSYLSVGYELGTEITFPESGSTMGALLFTLLQTFAVVFLPIANRLSEFFPDYVDIFMMSFYTGVLLLGLILAVLVKPDYRRQAVENSSKDGPRSNEL